MIPQPPADPSPRSLHLRITVPVFLALLVVSLVGAYLFARATAANYDLPQMNLLQQSIQAASGRANTVFERQRREAQRLALTVGVSELLSRGQAQSLEEILRGPARLSNLDGVVLTDADGREVLSLLRAGGEGQADYTASMGADLSQEPIIAALKTSDAAAGWLRTPAGLLLVTGVPVVQEGRRVGMALAGQQVAAVMADLQTSAVINLALYGPDGRLLQTSLPLETDLLSGLAAVPSVTPEWAARAAQAMVQPITLAGQSYLAAYAPFWFGDAPQGLLAALLPDSLPTLTEAARHATALLLAALAGATVIILFIAVSSLGRRAGRVARTAAALATGEMAARTGMRPHDPIGAAGYALDRYADAAQQRQDALRLTLRRHRREAEHLLSVLETLPDGIIVQDADGHVMLMNDVAKRLLGSQRVFRGATLNDLTAVVTDVLGASLAPGVYALGDPQRVELDGRMLQARAAALADLAGQRVGTVIMLRDITDEVRRERARETLFDRVYQEVQQPVAELLYGQVRRDPSDPLPRALARHAVALQKLIVEMRELSLIEPPDMRKGQRALLLDTLVWTIANEWRQIAQAANLTLDVMIEQGGLYILGDERRLRWAVGNLVDNAIKYTPPGGKLSLEVRGEDGGQALLRIRDTGVGISPEDLPQVFTRFFRGTPVTAGGRVIRVPGTGQGLTLARQIIEAHGGRIEIRSKPGQGTAVYFTLPLTAPVHLTLPGLSENMDGETVPLPRDARHLGQG